MKQRIEIDGEYVEVDITSFDDIPSTELDWLWQPYIPYGKITIVQGDPGNGKTTFVLQLAKLLSRGEKLPCSDEEREPIDIIYQTAEDGLSDTIKPRLEQAGADCSRIHIINDDDRDNPLTLTDARIEAAIKINNVKLLIIDPIQAFLGASVDMNRANEIRPVMARLLKIASKYDCAVIMVGHMNKGKGTNAAYRGLGSIDFIAAARSVLLIGKIKKEPNTRVMLCIKSNLAMLNEGISFHMDEETGFTWTGHYDISVDELMSGGKGENKTDKAISLLKEILEDGQALQSEVMDRAREAGISKRVIDTAKKVLEVKSVKVGAKWYWELS